jgi:hypothetical protein
MSTTMTRKISFIVLGLLLAFIFGAAFELHSLSSRGMVNETNPRVLGEARGCYGNNPEDWCLTHCDAEGCYP